MFPKSLVVLFSHLIHNGKLANLVIHQQFTFLLRNQSIILLVRSVMTLVIKIIPEVIIDNPYGMVLLTKDISIILLVRRVMTLVTGIILGVIINISYGMTLLTKSISIIPLVRSVITCGRIILTNAMAIKKYILHFGIKRQNNCIERATEN